MDEAFFIQSANRLLNECNPERVDRAGILSIFGKSHGELAHSMMLCSLLKPNEFEISTSIDSSFLTLMEEACGTDFTNEHILQVEREKHTDQGRSIDLNITTESYNIIIENKIYAADQPGQLEDYLDYAAQCLKPRIPIVIYLTLYGVQPSEYSISKKRLDELIRDHRFGAISYEKDILKWLDAIEAKGVLSAEIEVYKDAIKELCGMHTDNEALDFGRKHYYEMKNSFIADSVKASVCVTGIAYIKTTALYLEMLRVLFSILENDESEYPIRFVFEQSELFSCYDDFEKVVVSNNSPYGLAVDIDRRFRIGIEFNPSSALANGNWYFGYMKGVKGTNAEIEYPSNIDEYNLTPDWEDEGWKILRPSNWWGKSVEVSGLINSLLGSKQISDTAKDVSTWFNNQISYLKRKLNSQLS